MTVMDVRKEMVNKWDGDEDVWEVRYVKMQLMKHYGDDIWFASTLYVWM